MNCLPRRALPVQAATVLVASLGTLLGTVPAQADTTLTPGVTGTEIDYVHSDGYQITGGERSGTNLFHHFLEFNIGTGDAATFLVTDSVENVISLIQSSNASQIDGLLGLSGGNANLYLVNPSGVIFGWQAQLAIPANLFVTTASGLGVDEMLASVMQPNDEFYAAGLDEPPSTFVFSPVLSESEQTGRIVNNGSLTVSPGHSITFLANNIHNSGTLGAPGGSVILAAVPYQDAKVSFIRLERQGSPLALEITSTPDNLPPFIPTPIGPETLPPTALPALLTGGSADEVGRIELNADGSRSLVSRATSAPTSGPNFLEPGTVVLQGNIDVSDDVGGEVSVMGSRVAMINADVNANGLSAAGTIQIGSVPMDVQPDEPVRLETIYTYADRNTGLSARGLTPESRGGHIRVWAENTTQYYGAAEVSGEGSTLTIDAGVRLHRIPPQTSPRDVSPTRNMPANPSRLLDW